MPSVDKKRNRTAGYLNLVDKLELRVFPNWHISYVADSGSLKTVIENGRVKEYYPKAIGLERRSQIIWNSP